MKHYIYIASTLDNAPRVRQLRDTLCERQIGLTYDWTSHNDGVPRISDDYPELKRQIAEQELRAVRDAEAVLVVLPGGSGTHFEMAAAFCWQKPIVLFIDKPTLYLPSFYYLQDINIALSEPEAIKMLLNQLTEPVKTDHFIDQLMREQNVKRSDDKA